MPPLAVKEVEDPAQSVVVPEMLIVGAAFTDTVVAAEVAANPCAL